MQHNHSGRIAIIVGVLTLGLVGIFWPFQRLFNSQLSFSQKTNLRPGIDIAGGTRVMYEIKAPPGGVPSDLSQQVAAALKKRVDPDGVRNLVWRPQGPTRLEIQMPLTANANSNHEAREKFKTSEQNLAATNIRRSDIDAALNLPAEQREAKFKAIANGSETRLKDLQELTGINDKINEAIANRDLEKRVSLEPRRDAIIKKLEATNIDLTQFQAALDFVDKAVETSKKEKEDTTKAEKDRTDKISEFAGLLGDDPARQEAVKQFAASYRDLRQSKGTLGDAEDLKRELQGSGVLEFHILVPNQDLQRDDASAMTQRLKPQNGEPAKGVLPMQGDTMRWYEVDHPGEMHSQAMFDFANKKWILCYNGPLAGGQDSSITPMAMIHKEGMPAWGLQKAFPEYDQRSGETVVGFEFDRQGGKLFGELSGGNINKALGIILDEKVISAPNLISRIEGRGIITGDRTEKDRQYLISTLNAGSLPASLASQPISERTVSPQIGGDNLRAGLYACFIGLAVVCVFMVVYYHTTGVIAFIAVLMNFVMILGVLAMFNATFTLPGIAALVLTVGTSVDANVLIFERLREEQHRGLSLRMAVHNAYDRAFSAILDSNVITVITSLVLFGFGSEEVKGFGLTLLIGILTSLFTSLFVTKTIIDVMIDQFGLKKLGSLPLSYPKWDKMLKPNIDWMGKAWIFYVVSIVIIVTGLSAFFIRGREMFDIEFASGTSVEFELKADSAMSLAEVRKTFDDAHSHALPALSVVAITSTQDKDRNYEVVTPNGQSNEVKDAVMKILGSKLNVDPSSTFDGSGQGDEKADDTFVKAMGVAVFKPEDIKNAGAPWLREDDVANFSKGVAIILKNLSPPLPRKAILERVERARLSSRDNTYRDVKVLSPRGDTEPTDTAVILVSEPDVTSTAETASDHTWSDKLAKPMWTVTVDAIRRPPALQKVTNFSPQVAADMKTDAGLALALSIGLVMVYIWLRFSNFKFGTATVVAMLHDVLIAIGVIGLSHIASDYIPGLSKALLLEPFRMNLTLVAAVLTVMSYSMIDTIVVFDRIRENRGKFGHLDRQLINDSINQTLSRTLLTAGTTLSTVFVMYVFGGPGIHGFTFVLLVGILVGTYSSIAIAAPLLLLGSNKKTAEAERKTSVARVQRIGA